MPGKKLKERIFEISRSITEANDAIAKENRKLLSKKGIFCVNIEGAPGCGKTTLIEGLAKHLNPNEVAVIEGDLASDIDKKRLRKSSIYAHQVNTKTGCHLNADMIRKALGKMDLRGRKYLLIENVGNLVCPAGVDLGQSMNIVVNSTAEGWDKPAKYPPIFLDADIAVISKTDIADAVGFNERGYMRYLKGINPNARVVKVSNKDKSSYKKAAQEIENAAKDAAMHADCRT
jgi:hydrogenase nickel incorporation protein HypB